MPFKAIDTIEKPSTHALSEGKISIEKFVAEMSHEDRTVATTAGRKLWKVVRHAGRPSASDERVEVESQLKISLDAKLPNGVIREILWMLSEIGGNQSVDNVAKLLSHRDFCEDARMALERIPGEKSLLALRSAFDAVDEDFKSNIAQSLRARSVPIEGTPCQKLIPVKDTEVREI